MLSAVVGLVLLSLATPASTHGTCTRPDFDGDGTIDKVEEVAGSCGTGGCVYRVSLANGRALGTIEGLCSFTVQPRRGKLADVVTTWRLGAVDSVVTRYRFDGRRYRRVSSRS